MRDHRHGRSSAEDPTISSTRSGKSVPSNARNHPRAELKDSDTPRQTEAGSSGGRQSQGRRLQSQGRRLQRPLFERVINLV